MVSTIFILPTPASRDGESDGHATNARSDDTGEVATMPQANQGVDGEQAPTPSMSQECDLDDESSRSIVKDVLDNLLTVVTEGAPASVSLGKVDADVQAGAIGDISRAVGEYVEDIEKERIAMEERKRKGAASPIALRGNAEINVPALAREPTRAYTSEEVAGELSIANLSVVDAQAMGYLPPGDLGEPTGPRLRPRSAVPRMDGGAEAGDNKRHMAKRKALAVEKTSQEIASIKPGVRVLFDLLDRGHSGNIAKEDFFKCVTGTMPEIIYAIGQCASLAPLLRLRHFKRAYERLDGGECSTMEWDEFTGFCMEAGMVATRSVE